jgi:hypothetical protein
MLLTSTLNNQGMVNTLERIEMIENTLVKDLDCCGQFMPQPICDIKKALEAGFSIVRIISDSRIICENIRRFASHTGLKLEVTCSSNGRYDMKVTRRSDVDKNK